MELIDIINKIIQQNTEAQKMTNLAIGTVTELSPLAITTNANLPPIPEEAIILTDSVKKRIVRATGAGTGTGTGEVTTSHDPVTTTVTTTVVTDVEVQNDLEVGDGVVMLRVLGGQKYIVLSKIV